MRAELAAVDVSGRTESVREAHRQLVGYVGNQVHRMDYPTYRSKHWSLHKFMSPVRCRV